jgi:hypothetical protein
MNRLLLAVPLLAVCATAPAKLYKWVDADGNVTYSERKPPDAQAEEVRLLGVPSVSSEEARERLDRVNESLESLRKDREFKEEYASDSAEREARLKENCETARRNLRILETASRVKDADGSFIDDSTREARIATARQQIEDNCN